MRLLWLIIKMENRVLRIIRNPHSECDEKLRKISRQRDEESKVEFADEVDETKALRIRKKRRKNKEEALIY